MVFSLMEKDDFEPFGPFSHLLCEMRKAEKRKRPKTFKPQGHHHFWSYVIIVCFCLLPNTISAAVVQVTPPPPAPSLQISKPLRRNVKSLYCTAPDIKGMTHREAAIKLRKLGLRIKVVKSIYHPTIPTGHVISQSPPPAKKIPEESTIEIIISKGPAPMPNLKGKTWAKAVKIFSGKNTLDTINFAPYHLRVVRKNVLSKRMPETIVDQVPPKGRPLHLGSTVTLLVSKGNVRSSRTITPSVVSTNRIEKNEHIFLTQSPRTAKSAARNLEASSIEPRTPRSSRPISKFYVHKKRLTEGVPVKLQLKGSLSRQTHPVFYLGNHKLTSRHSKHPNEVLLNTKGVPAGNYPLIAMIRGKREVIGHIRIVKTQEKSTNILHPAKTVREHPNKPHKMPSTVSPTSPQVSSQKSKHAKSFVFMVDTSKFPRLKDTLLKEAPWMKIVKRRQLKSLKATIVSIQTTHPEKAKKFAEKLISRKIIKHYQASHIYRTFGTEGDPFVSRQYGCQPSQRLKDIQASCSGKGIHVALLDTGVDIYHEDLNGKAIETEDFTEEGLGKFLTGIHGTALAGIIAAIPNNGKGIMGIAPGVKLHAIKVCKSVSPSSIEATTDSFTLAEGLDYAIQKRVHIINVSIGGPRDKIIEKLIRKARGSGIIVVAAVGNGGSRSPPTYPAAYPGVIGVTAIDQDMKLYPEAPRGRFVDIAAPGVDVFSLKPGNRYNFYTGTSFAAAYVTAVLALRLSCNSKTNPSIMNNPLVLLRTAAYIPPHLVPDRIGKGILILSKIPERTFVK